MRKLTTKEFIEKAIKIHGNKYDYSKVKYKKTHEKVCIICPRHGEFWQSPIKHINAKNNCPKCNMSKLEELTSLKLKETNVSYKYQATSKDLEWLGKLTLDFYLPEYKVAIECQGIQHFKPIKFGGKNDTNSIIRFMEQIKRDKIKKKLCEENNVKLMCIENINELNINEIKKSQ